MGFAKGLVGFVKVCVRLPTVLVRNATSHVRTLTKRLTRLLSTETHVYNHPAADNVVESFHKVLPTHTQVGS